MSILCIIYNLYNRKCYISYNVLTKFQEYFLYLLYKKMRLYI